MGVITTGGGVQERIDQIVYLNAKTGIPNSGRVTHQGNYANGGLVKLGPGTIKFKKPLKLYGMVTLAGEGPSTFLDFTGADEGAGAIDLYGTELGGPGSEYAHNWSGVRDLAIATRGHGFFSSSGGSLCPRIERVQICSGGWGVYLPTKGPKSPLDHYSQDLYIADVLQINPGSGGVLVRGNQNSILRYRIFNGTGGPVGAKFRSPWETDELGMIDVGGQGNLIEGCHIEFNVGRRPDGMPNALVLSYGLSGNQGFDGTAFFRNNWHEIWPNEAFSLLGFSTRVDNCVVHGDLTMHGGIPKYVNGGRSIP